MSRTWSTAIAAAAVLAPAPGCRRGRSTVDSRLAGGAIALLLVAAPAPLACADAGGEGTAAAPAGIATPGVAPGSEVPAELRGTWATTLRRSELAEPPDDLTQTRSAWRLKILGTGGTDNGPSMYLANDRLGEVLKPVAVYDDRIRLQIRTDCRVFAYTVDAERLTLTSAESGCPSTSISSVLTARPWNRRR